MMQMSYTSLFFLEICLPNIDLVNYITIYIYTCFLESYMFVFSPSHCCTSEELAVPLPFGPWTGGRGKQCLLQRMAALVL